MLKLRKLTASYSIHNFTKPISNKYRTFDKCERCGSENIYSGFFFHELYGCVKCNYMKSDSSLIFGFPIKFENYFELYPRYSIENLKLNNGSKLEAALNTKNNDAVWKTWVSQNKLEIIKLASLSENHLLGFSPFVPEKHNLLNYITRDIRNQKGNYLNNIKLPRKKLKINNNWRYTTNNVVYNSLINIADEFMWIGGSREGHPKHVWLKNKAIRTNKKISNFIGYKPFSFYKNDSIGTYKDFPKVIYITGPIETETIKHGYDKKLLDVYVAELLDNYRNENIVVINSGTNGVEQAALRWTARNNKYYIRYITDDFIVNSMAYIFEDVL